MLRVFRVGALGISGFSVFRVGCFWGLFFGFRLLGFLNLSGLGFVG